MSTSEVLALIQEVVEKSADGDYVYRGEPECYPKVSSALYRLYEDVDAEHFDIEEVQKEILDKARRYTSATDELEILAELQHHGGKTNLIDFTTDYHIALFFACDGFHDKDGRLILLKEATEQGQIRQPRNPVNRVIAQKSVFVQPPKGFVEPDAEIDIPKALKQPILNHLRKYHGISTETIYNDLHGFIKNQGIHQSAYTEFFRGFTSSSKGEESKIREEQRGHYQKAITHYDAALKLNPNLAEAYANRGHAKQELGRHEEAIADYDTAIRINPRDAVAYTNRGTAKQDLGRHEEAIADYDTAIRINPQYAAAYSNRGTAKQDLGRHEEAIADYDTAIRINPQYTAAYSNRGTAKQDLGRHEEAMADHDTAIRINPQYAVAYYNRGNVKHSLGRHEAAIADYDAALRLNPQLAVAYSSRGIAKQKLGWNEEAREDFQKCLALAKQQDNEKVAQAAQKALDNLGTA